MKSSVFRAQSVLQKLQKYASKENEISSLTILNEIISSSQEEVEFLYNSDGIAIIMSFLESDPKLEIICLKVLTNASKRHEKIKSKLLENNIFHLLAIKLKNETNFFNNNLMLYSALIVVLVRGNNEAQNQIGTSGCLSSLTNILNSILNNTNINPLPSRITELIIYAIIASNKGPRHPENQKEIGWIAPKILKYLGKQSIFSDSNQLHIIKSFWFFLKTILDKNEVNQQIFLKSSGVAILFRSIQDIVEKENRDDMADLLVKMTGVLVKLKSNKEFLYAAFNYCPILILCNLLKTCNSLVIQHSIIFLNSLTFEFPQVLDIIKNNEVLRIVGKAKTILLQNNTSSEICQGFWNSMEILDETQSQKTCLTSSAHFNFGSKSENSNFWKPTPQLSILPTHFCVVHDADSITNSQTDSESTFNPSTSNGVKYSVKNEEKNEGLSKTKFSNFQSHRKELKDRQRKLRKIINHNFTDSLHESETSFNPIRVASRRIKQILEKFSFKFFGILTDDLYNRFFH